ncbi:hypothetical protein B0H11DRAFT_2233491 [Mycena galericulata]|nr:hypothetical protein B0H11DRAFT_2233491 [Mycena galericulata]
MPPAPRRQIDSEERRFMANFRCSTYHTRHREERNTKTRSRMAALRARESTLPVEEQERRREARRASAAKYREKNAWRLAKVAREARNRARIIREQAKAQAQIEEARHREEEERAAEQAALEAKLARQQSRRRRREQRAAERLQLHAEQEAAIALLNIAFADPQTGESYVSMDYDLLFALHGQGALRTWYESGCFTAAAREMGPAVHHDVLDGESRWPPVTSSMRDHHIRYIALDDHREWWDARLLEFTLGWVSTAEDGHDAALEPRWVITFWHTLCLALLLLHLDLD